jgi:hypothetical protein
MSVILKKISSSFSPLFSKDIMNIPDFDERHKAMDLHMQLEETKKKLVVAKLQQIFDEEKWMFSGIKTQEFQPEGREDILSEIEEYVNIIAPEDLNNIDIVLIFNPRFVNKCSNITFLTRQQYCDLKNLKGCWTSGTFQNTPIYNEKNEEIGKVQFSYVEKAFADYAEVVTDLDKKYEMIGKNQMYLVESIEKTVLGNRLEYSISALTTIKAEYYRHNVNKYREMLGEEMREIFIKEFKKRCDF